MNWRKPEDERGDAAALVVEDLDRLAALGHRLLQKRTVGLEHVGGVGRQPGALLEQHREVVAVLVQLRQRDVEVLRSRHDVLGAGGQLVGDGRQVGEELLGVTGVGGLEAGELLAD